jgi:integrase
LRRKEAATLSVEHIQLRDARWVIVRLIGKGGRVRTVPMPSWAKRAIDAWMAVHAISCGLVFRRMAKGGRVIGESMSARSIFQLVPGAGAMIGVPNLAPHDL